MKMDKEQREKRIKILKLRKEEDEEEIKDIDEELRYLDLPEQIIKEFQLMFGWPRISQELQLEKALGKDLYNKLYNEISMIIEKCARMVPDYEEQKKSCKICDKIKELFHD